VCRRSTVMRSDIRVESFPLGNALPADVVALVEDSVCRSGVQGSSAWFRLLANESFSVDADAKMFVVRRCGLPIAAVPLMLGDRRSTVESACNYFTSLYVPALESCLSVADLVPLIDAVRAHWPNAHRWILAPLDRTKSELEIFRTALEAKSYRTFPFFRFANWRLDCTGLQWDNLLASRSGAVRNTVRRARARLKAAGANFQLVTSVDGLDAALDAYATVYRASWKRSEPQISFVRKFCHHAAERGWLRLGFVWLGDQPVAAQLWFVAHQRAEIFKLAYDERYRRLSVGTALTSFMIEHAIDLDGVTEIDYLSGDDAYKSAWMNQRHERHGLVAYDDRTFRGLAGALRELTTVKLKALRHLLRPEERKLAT
jgi:ribosomal protein S18 acetylase RimI-like enzyme